MFVSGEDTTITDGPPSTPLTGSTNMAIILCVEKGQPKEISLQFFINDLKQNIPDYFDKATFGNYDVNITDVLVKDIDSSAGYATLFELPDTVYLYPPIGPCFVVCPEMVTNILDQADSIYNFNDFDSDSDGIVDYVAFMLIRYRGGWSTGTVGLSINSFYTTNDSTPSGVPIRIDGRGYLSGSNRAIIQRKFNASSETLIAISAHELGHSLFGFPDMDHSGGTSYPHYALGQFCAMSGGGFAGRASLYNPIFRSNKGWTSPNQISSNQTITFSNFDLTGQIFYYDLPNFNYNSPPVVQTASGQKIYLTYYNLPSSIRWQEKWPIPKSPFDQQFRGILTWHTRSGGGYSDRYNLPIDIESAHGKWRWINDRADTVTPPNDKHAIMSSEQKPLTGLDSIEVRYSYNWLRFDSTGIDGRNYYTEIPTYPDRRIGSETCFFDPINPKKFTFYTNPNSNHTVTTGTPDSRSLVSGFMMNNLRLDGSYVKADFTIGEGAVAINENVTLPKGTWRFISNLTVGGGKTLTIQPGTELRFYNGSSIIVNGSLLMQGTFAEQIILDFVNNQSSGISVRNGGTINLDYCTIKNASTGISTFHSSNNITVNHSTFENITNNAISVGSNTQKLEVYNSTFSSCGSYCINIFGPMYTTPKIHYNFFQNTNYGILASSVNSVFINWNSFTTNQLGISVIQVPNAYVNGNYLFSTQGINSGIFFNNSNGYIRQNVINGFKRAISLANSSPKVGENQISFNKVNGIYASSGSVPDLRLYLGLSQTPGCPPYYYALSGCNEITDNGGYTQFPMEVGDDGSEIYLSKSSILLDIGNNKIYDDREEIPPLYHTLLLMNGTTNQDGPILARYNWWGLTEVSRRRFGNLSVIYDPIGADDCPVPIYQPCVIFINDPYGAVVDSLYPLYEAEEFSEVDEEIAIADKYYLAGDYSNAINAYNNVVQNYPDSIQAFLAGSQLFTISKIQNSGLENFTALQNFYDTYASNVSDTLLVKMIENLITLCYIGKEEYETAIGRLEAIIVQNPGEEEAIYAEIDAVTAAMLANGGGGNLGKYSGKYSATSLDDYGIRIGELVAKLGSSGSVENKESVIPDEYKLYQNYPNPFNPVTTIKYDIVKAQDVKLVIYDLLGREVTILVNAQQQPGSYEVSWDASNFATGIYFYTLTSGNFKATKKLILLK